jgi:hypothetical protein
MNPTERITVTAKAYSYENVQNGNLSNPLAASFYWSIDPFVDLDDENIVATSR